MIKINVFSEEKSWSKKLKDKESFFKKICQAFPKKYKFLKKEISFSLELLKSKYFLKHLFAFKFNSFFLSMSKSMNLIIILEKLLTLLVDTRPDLVFLM